MEETNYQPQGNLKKYFDIVSKIIPVLLGIFGISLVLSVTMTEIVKSVMFLLYIPYYMYYRRQIFKRNFIGLFLLLFIIWTIISTIFSPDINRSLYVYKFYINIIMFPVGICVTLFHTKQLKWFIFGLIAGSIIQLIFVVICAVFEIKIDIESFNLNITSYNRPTGTQNTPGNYASVSVMATLFIMMLPIFMQKTKVRTAQIIAYITAILIFTGIIISKTRGAMIACFIAIILYIFIYAFVFGKKRSGIILSIVTVFSIGALLLIFYLLFPDIIKRIGTIFNYFETNEGSCRYVIYEKSFLSVLDKPILGHGPYTFFMDLKRCNAVYHSHNNYLEIAYASGLPALIFFVAMEVLVIFKLFKNMLKNKSNHLKGIFYLALLTSYTAFMMYSFSDYMLVNVSASPFVFFMLGIISRSESLR